MTNTNNPTAFPPQPIPLYKPVLIGSGIALILISLFLYGVDNPSPEWGKFWMIRPLIIVSLAGAVGGAFFYFMDLMATRGMNRTFAVILSLLVYVVGLWIGSVLGLDGTLWN